MKSALILVSRGLWLVLLLTAPTAVVAQHGASGGSTSGSAVGTVSTSRTVTTVSRPRTPPAARRRTAPVRRGATAEQYVEQGDTFYKAKEYDDALEAYSKGVELKPIAHAYYQIGWI